MQYILITGVSTGIGREMTRYLIEKGFFVLGSVRKQEDAASLKKDFPKQFHPLIFDVCDAHAIQKAKAETESILGKKGLSGLVNNAGIAINGPLQHVEIDDLHRQFDVNVYGALRVTQAFLPLLGAQLPAKYPPGKIINISSVSGFVTAPFLAPYAMSKYALESMSDGLRRELSIYGIDVLVLEPGAVKSEIWDKAKQMDRKFLATDYGPILKNWENMVNQSEVNAIPATEIAKKTHQLLLKKQPATRQIIAKQKWLMRMVKYVLSDRFLDKQLTKSFKKQLSIEE